MGDETETAFATKDSLAKYRNRRRFCEFDWVDVGRVVLQSARAAEFIRIDAARQRATMAAMAGDVAKHEQATREFLLLVCYLLVLDEHRQPFFSEDDKQLILDLDSAVTDPLVDAATRHCSIRGLSLEDAQKN